MRRVWSEVLGRGCGVPILGEQGLSETHLLRFKIESVNQSWIYTKPHRNHDHTYYYGVGCDGGRKGVDEVGNETRRLY